MRGSRGGGGAWGPNPRKDHKNIEFLSKTGLDTLKNHKAIKLAFHVGPSSARQRTFRGRAHDGPLIVVFGSSLLPSSTKKERKENRALSEMDTLWQNFLDLCMFLVFYMSVILFFCILVMCFNNCRILDN